MAKNDVDLDNMDLDDFDFGIPEWNAEEEVDEKSRSPITRAAKGALAGAKSEIATPGALKKALAMALPSGYGLAADTLEEGASDVRSLYDTILGESPELVRGSKSFGRKSMQLLGNKILPKSVADRLNSAMEDSEDSVVKSSAEYRREQEESDIAQLAEIFKAKAGADEEHAKADASDKLENKAMDHARFETNVQYLSSINRSMARLVGYQDKIGAKYQQKMLELNYRQYATQKQLLDLMSESTKKQTLILETIRHNTALPEAVKIRGSEMFSQLARQKLLGSGLNTISNWTQNYGKQVLSNVKGVADGILDPIREAQSMSGDLGEGVDKANIGGRAVGSMIGGTIRDQAAIHLAPHLAKNKFIAKGGEKLRKTFTGLPQKMNEYAQSETEGTGYKSVMKQMFKTFLPQFSLDSRTGGDSVDLLDESTSFDKIARRSLIEVIPGYLSEIAHWSKVAVTGEKNSEKEVFNVVRGGFTTQKEQLKDVSRQIMSRSERDSLRSSAEDFIQSIGGETLSSKAQRALKKKLLDELANGHDLVPKRLADPASYPNVDPDTVEEITSLIIDSFGLDYNGEMADKSTESDAKFNDIREKYLSMASMVPAAGDRIRVLGDVLGKDSLRKLGFIERQGREDRINFDKIWSDIVDENDEEGTIGSDEGNTDVPDRISERDSSNIRTRKVRGPSASRASRADSMVAGSQKVREGGRGGLEFFLGDKSTLITLITQSRDFHAEEVDLLKQLAACGCPGEPRGDRGALMMDSVSAHAKRVKAQGSKLVTAAHTKATDTFKFGQEKYGAAKTLVQDIWIEGEDHPRLQEVKLKAGEYRDKVTNEVITRWEDISGDVIDLKGRTVVSYHEFMDSGVLADYKGKVVKRASDLIGKFKESKAGSLTKATFQRGMAKFDRLSENVRPTLVAKSETIGKELSKQRRQFKPRLKSMMSRFTGGKLGSDISSELTGDQEQDMLTLSLRSVQLQYETLKQVTKEKVRKGSFQEINAKRKGLIEQGKEKIKGKTDGIQGLLGKAGGISGLLAMLGGGADGADGEDGGGGWMRDIGDLFGGGGGDDDKKKKKKNKKTMKRRGGRKGILGKITNMGGRALDKMGRFGKIAKFGGKTVGKLGRLGWGATKMLGRGLKGAGSIGRAVLTNPVTRMVAGHAGRWAIGAAAGAAGLVSAPVLAAIGVGIGVVAIGGYIYSKTKDKLAPLTRLRMVQYGIKPKTESDELTLIGGLEKIFAGVTSVDAEGKATINTKSLPQDQIMSLFKIDTNIPPEENSAFKRLTSYLTGRFSAVFLVHVSNLYALTKSTDLSKVDEKLTGKVAMSFAEKVGMQDRSDVFNARIGPFKSEKLPMDADDVASMWAEVKAELAKAMKKEVIDNSPAAKTIAGSIALKVVEAKAESMVAANKAAAAKETASTASTGDEVAAVETDVVLSKTEVKMVDGVAMVTSSMTEKGKTVLATRAYQDSSFDTGKAVRFRAYGLTEMMVMKVSQLDTLEYMLFKQVKYGNEKEAIFDDDGVAWMAAESLFSPIGDEVDKVYKWFHRRFKPAFLQFCTSVRARSSMDARDAAKRLKPEIYLEVLREVANATDGSGASVWEIADSPWPGYIMNSDKESVKEALYLLSTKIKDKAIVENAGPVAGQVLDKDGKIIEQDGNQTNRPSTTDGQGGSGSGGGGADSNEPGVLSKAWSGIKSFFGGGDSSKPPQTGHVGASGQQTATGATEFPTGTPLSHPGGGTGGSVNELPMPKGDGWEGSKDTLMAAANMVGVDPNLAASIAGVESNYRPNALPYKNPRNPSAGVLSSAASYYQVIKGTWKQLMEKYAKKYGIHPNTTQHDPRANALLGLEFIRENVIGIKKVKSNVTDTDVYLSHFLGPSGGPRFLKAPPGDPAINHVGADQARSNPSIFYKNGRARTVADVYGDFDEKLKKHRKPDATTLAASLKGGEVLAEASVTDAETPADEAVAAASGPELTAPTVDVPSMVKPSEQEGATLSPAANTVIETAPTSDTGDLTEKADARQTQNTTAGLAMSAKTAEVQTSTQTASNAETYGGMDKQMGRLVDINQSQLTQLAELVELVRKSGLATATMTGATTSGSTQTSVNPNIDNPKAASRGTVAVSRT